jgi:para-aminobenzoate synthetase
MRTLLIDNYDSFTFNLFQLFAMVDGEPPLVVRNDEMAWSKLSQLDIEAIVISPGPGRPDIPRDFGVCADAILKFDGPILGVCLGHQGICHLLGGRVDYAGTVMHGRTSRIHHDGSALFAGIPQGFEVVRYHSLIVTEPGPEMRPTAWTEDGILMGVEHRQRPLWAVQFHPESICTEYGHKLAANFLELARAASPRRPGKGAWPGGSGGDPRSAIAPQPVAKGSPPPTLYSRKLAGSPNAEACFGTLFAASPTAFWLDSSLTTTTAGRFSFMGDAGGPLAEEISYDVTAHRVVRKSALGTTVSDESIFDALKRWSEERRIPSQPGVDLPFIGGWVGYLGYELKSDCGGAAVARSDLPDARFIFADRLVAFDHHSGEAWLLCLDEPEHRQRAEAWLDDVASRIAAAKAPGPAEPWVGGMVFRPHRDGAAYARAIADAKQAIRRGETYEVCLTNEFVAEARIDPLVAYRRLRKMSPAPHGAFLRFGETAVLSSSPERFMRIGADGLMEAKPIKGTLPRGATPAEDAALADALRSCTKNRAENLMIVDLLRNDLGRVSEIGSVSVPVLFGVESFATVHQLVSTVRGRLHPSLSAVEAVRAAFPGGSMTGARKIRTLEILDDLEGRARGIYSGAIGYFSVDGAVDLNIVIRTAVVHDGEVRIGAGGAIVDLSDIDDEIAEVLLKCKGLLAAFEARIAEAPPIGMTANELAVARELEDAVVHPA